MKNENKTLENRRKLLKTVAAGGGAIIAGKTLPEKWGRPVVDSVLLPAHAQTSTAPPAATTFSGNTTASIKTDSMFARAMDSLVPRAHAGGHNYNVSWCITPVSATTADVYFLLVRADNTAAELWSETGVAVGTIASPNKTNLSKTEGCSNLAVNAGEWMNKLSLIRDAEASNNTADVYLGSLAAGDDFRFRYQDYSIDFTMPLSFGFCGPNSVPCTIT